MLNWLFGKPRFRFYEDSFAKTRKSTLAGLRKAIDNRKETEDLFLIVCHFPKTFEELQDHLHAWELEYEIVSRPLRQSKVVSYLTNQSSRILLVLSDLLVVEETTKTVDATNANLCVMAVERHPSIVHDDRLEIFCRSLPVRVELGYFLSFEDPTVNTLINDATLRILDMFGMGENELITSNMISRRLRTVLTQDSKKYVSDLPADSAREWIQRNSDSNA